MKASFAVVSLAGQPEPTRPTASATPPVAQHAEEPRTGTSTLCNRTVLLLPERFGARAAPIAAHAVWRTRSCIMFAIVRHYPAREEVMGWVKQVTLRQYLRWLKNIPRCLPEVKDSIAVCARFPKPRRIRLRTLLMRMIRDESGVTAIEYALIAALIAVAAITVMTAVGTGLSTTFQSIATAL
jgi:pilus assembly protein Flp/PilA